MRTEVRLPRLLDSNLDEIRTLHPSAMSATLQLTGTSEATITIPDGEDVPPMHSLVEVYTRRGSVGVFRVTNVSTTYLGETQLTLRHARDLLADACWRAQEEFTGTTEAFLTRALTFQTALIGGGPAWQLGRCDCETQITKKQMNYEKLLSLLENIEQDEDDFCFTYDFTTSPWTINFIAKPAGVTSEFRLHRNAAGCTVTMDDSDLCNKLRLSANHVTTKQNGSKTSDTVWRDYENTSSQAVWGVVEKVADIEVSEDVKAGEHAETDAWAARFLAERAEPTVQIEITAQEIADLTGEDWDEADLGRLSRVALPGYDTTFVERVVTISYDDPLSDPTYVQISLANVLPKFSETLAQARDAAASAGRAAGRANREADVANSWRMIVQEIDEAVSGVGIKTFYETGIVLDAKSGATIYSLQEGLLALNSVLKVSATGVSSLVTAAGVQLDQDGHLVIDPDTGQPIYQSGQGLYSLIEQTAESIDSVVSQSGVLPGVGKFDQLKSYAVDDLVIFNGRTWKFIAAHPAGVWNQSHVELVPSMESRITQNSSAIALKVSQGDVATQLAVEVGNVTITGGNLLVAGYLEANGVSTSAGGTLTADTLEARFGEIDTVSALSVGTGAVTGCDSYTMDSYNGDLVDSVKEVQVIPVTGTSNYKLQYKTFKGDTWTDAGTFSRAAAQAPTLGGGWSSGKYTVTSDITPAAGSVTETTLFDLGLGAGWTLSGSGTSKTLDNTFDIGYAAVVGGQQVRGGSTGKTGSISVPIPLTTGTYSTVGTKYPSSGYAGFASVTITGTAGTISAATAQSQQPTGTNLRTVTVGTGGNKTYVRISATGSRDNNDYIQINY